VDFEELVTSRGTTLRRLALMLCGDPHLADDLVQNTLVKAYRRWSRIAASRQPYVKAMIVNEHLSWWRRRSHREVPVDVDSGTAPAAAEDFAGAQASRDAAWTLLQGVNDLGWGTPLHDTVIRAVGPQPDCAFSDHPRVQTATVEADTPVPGGLSARTVTLGKAHVRRAEGQRPDGRYTGWLQAQSPAVTLTVVTSDAATTRHILDSARPVTVDRLGCATRDNGETSAATPAGPGFVPAGQVSAAACLYAAGGSDDGLLEASAAFPPSNVAALVTALDAGPGCGSPRRRPCCFRAAARRVRPRPGVAPRYDTGVGSAG
jgi:hypothetical protein